MKMMMMERMMMMIESQGERDLYESCRHFNVVQSPMSTIGQQCQEQGQGRSYQTKAKATDNAR